MTEHPTPAAAGVPARPVHDPHDQPPGEGLAAGTQRSVGAGVENTPQPGPDQGDPERLAVAWSRWPATDGQEGGWWVPDRPYPLRYLQDVHGRRMGERWRDGRGREYRLFEHKVDPNDLEEGGVHG